jgi:hypothetical protein
LESAIAKITSEVKALLIGAVLEHIEFFNVNETYMVIDPSSNWIIDGGVEIKTEKNQFTFAWNGELDMFGYIADRSAIEFIDRKQTYALGAINAPAVADLIGREIVNVGIEWAYVNEFDDDHVLKPEKTPCPVEFFIGFQGGKSIQMACIGYDIEQKPFKIINQVYNLQGEMLIHLNHREIIDKRRKYFGY